MNTTVFIGSLFIPVVISLVFTGIYIANRLRRKGGKDETSNQGQ